MQEYKGFKIQADGTFSMYTIKPVGKGSIPKELRGRYTSYLAAQKQIDAYVKTKGKGNTNDETSSAS
jgi:hypothetical protein